MRDALETTKFKGRVRRSNTGTGESKEGKARSQI
jgi:hypothetical protein